MEFNSLDELHRVTWAKEDDAIAKLTQDELAELKSLEAKELAASQSIIKAEGEAAKQAARMLYRQAVQRVVEYREQHDLDPEGVLAA